MASLKFEPIYGHLNQSLCVSAACSSYIISNLSTLYFIYLHTFTIFFNVIVIHNILLHSGHKPSAMQQRDVDVGRGGNGLFAPPTLLPPSKKNFAFYSTAALLRGGNFVFCLQYCVACATIMALAEWRTVLSRHSD